MRSDLIVAAAICALVAVCQRSDRRGIERPIRVEVELVRAVEHRPEAVAPAPIDTAQATFVDASRRKLDALEREIAWLEAASHRRERPLVGELREHARLVHAVLDDLADADADTFERTKDDGTDALAGLEDKLREARRTLEQA